MFEWDEGKNQRNFEKHGIAFEDVLPVFANRQADLCPAREQTGEAGL